MKMGLKKVDMPPWWKQTKDKKYPKIWIISNLLAYAFFAGYFSLLVWLAIQITRQG
jgi:hypothetical protein